MPGLINAHDHLEFNLYLAPRPRSVSECRRLGARRLPSERLPHTRTTSNCQGYQTDMGWVKESVSGVTTVCHHNPRELSVFDRNFPVRVLKQFGWAHSLEFSPQLAGIFRATPPDWPFILHLGEGSDRKAQREIFQLDELGALDERTVLVHAIGLDRAGLRLAKGRGASIVWCPSSNLFLFGRTLDGAALASGVPIALGSDSALTGAGDLLDEIGVARKASGISIETLYRMVTSDAARILRLPQGSGC